MPWESGTQPAVVEPRPRVRLTHHILYRINRGRGRRGGERGFARQSGLHGITAASGGLPGPSSFRPFRRFAAAHYDLEEHRGPQCRSGLLSGGSGWRREAEDSRAVRG